MNSVSRQGFLPKHQQRVLSTTKVGMVGAGGGGSAIIQQLAHIGFDNYLVIDPDRIEDTNLNRLIGGTLWDVRLRRRKVNIAGRTISRLRPDANIEMRCCKWQQALEELKSCDVIIGAVDGYGERDQLEAFCRRFLIPYIDIGMDVMALADGTHLISGQVIVSIPGGPCMRCCHFLTDDALQAEAARYGAAGVRPQVVWPNGMLASAAVGELMQLVLPWFRRTQAFTYLVHDGNKHEVRPSPHVAALSGIECPHHPFAQVGDPMFKASELGVAKVSRSWLTRLRERWVR